tara:strand:+ start:3577 stop:4395 length:819 start_codon:yes stop_codon:yes gene_type:complete
MKITRRELRHVIRENLALILEAHDPGELVQVGPVSVLIYGRYDVGTAPFYLVYLPKGTKLDGNDVMTPTDNDIDGWIKNKRVTWGKQANGNSWKENPQRLKKLAKEGRFKFLNDFAKAKGIKVDVEAKISFNTDALEWSLLGLGFVADFFPGAGTAISTGLNLSSMGLALKKKNYLGVALCAVAIMVPAGGDAIAILGRAVKDGKKVTPSVARKAFNAMTKISDKQLRGWLSDNGTKLGIKVSDEIMKKVASELTRFKNALNKMSKSKAAVA